MTVLLATLVQHIYGNMTKGWTGGFVRSVGDNPTGNGDLGAALYASRGWIEVDEPTALGMIALWGLQKAGSHKHFKKVPTGKYRMRKDGSQGAMIYRYFYKPTAGKGVGHEDELVHGSAHRGTHNGKVGHWQMNDG